MAGDYGIAPGLQHYFKQHVDIPDDEYKITRRQDASIPSTIEYDGSWVPDLVVDIRRLADWATIATYFCEIKSGDASFERQQREGMESLAETHTVLQIRVDIEALPNEYTLRIDTVDPSSLWTLARCLASWSVYTIGTATKFW